MDPVVSVQKQKLLRKHKGACKSSWSQLGSPKSFTLTIPWNLAKLVKIFLGMIGRRHHTDQRQMGLLTEQCAEWKKAPLRYCCNQVWIKNGGQILYNSIPIRETFKISSYGKTPYKRLFREPFKGPIIPLGSLCWVLPYLCERPVKNLSICKESLTWIVPWIRSLRGGNLEGWHDGCRHWGAGNDGHIGNLRKKWLDAKEVIFPTENGKFIFPIADGRIKSHGRDQDLRTSTLVRHRPIQGEGHVDFLGESEGSLSTTSRLISGCRWSDKWFLVYVRKLQKNRHHVEPRAKLYSPREESFPIPMIFLTYRELQERIWILCKSATSMTIVISMDQETCLILGQVSLSLLFWKRPPDG